MSNLILTFGKYENKPIGIVPAHYLLWLYKQPWCKEKYYDIFNYIKENENSLIREDLDGYEWEHEDWGDRDSE